VSTSAFRVLVLATSLGAAPLLAGAVQEQAKVAAPPQTLAARLEAVRTASDLPAIAGVSFRSDTILEVAARGVRRLGDPVEVTTGDLWHIGSITKSFTSALIGKYVERQELTWSTTLGDVFGARAGKFGSVTLVDLLSHRAGLPPNLTSSHDLQLQPGSTVTDHRKRIVDVVLAGEPGAKPGEQYLYSNLGYVIAGALLEQKTGRAWEDLVRAEIIAPLKLSSVGFGAPGAPGSLLQPRGHRQAAATSATGAKLVPIEPPLADNPPFLGPAGTMHMTVGDLARWGQEHLRGERGTDGLLRAATFRRLHVPPRPDATYALGWVVRRDGDRRTIWHNGSNTLWYAIVAFDPDADLGVVIATNGSIAAARAIDAAATEVLKEAGKPGSQEARKPGSQVGVLSFQTSQLPGFRAQQSVRHPHPVPQHGRPVHRDRHHELRRPRFRLRPLVRRLEHAPRAADRLVHLDRDRRGLVIAKRDLVLNFVHARRDLLEVGLLALADDVERVADLEVQRLVLRRVVDAVLTDELHGAA
jgi:CubicO group peptidase (beta-lactamase class C family)